jgi:hypothetical protein
LGSDDEMQRLRRAAGDAHLEKVLKRNAARESCPVSLALRLDNLYSEKFGGNARSRLEPFLTFYSDNLLKTILPATLEEAAPQCPLAIVDFGRSSQRQWTEMEIFVMFEYIVDLPTNQTIVVMVTVQPGLISANVHAAVQRLIREKRLNVHVEFGMYRRDGNPRPVTRLWDCGFEELIFVGISHEETFRWEELFTPDEKAVWFFSPSNDCDFAFDEKKRREKEKGKGKSG